jgi:competence protein ComEC
MDALVGENIDLEGYINSEPESKDTSQKFYFKANDFDDQISISSALYPTYTYGQNLKIKAILKFPENFEAYPGGPIFDYISYLSKDGVRYTMSRSQIIVLPENSGNKLIKILLKIKGAFMGNIERLMPEPHSSLVAGILLGEKGSLPEEIRNNFRRSGLTHILVLSGSNVSVVASTLMSVFSFLPRTLAASFGAFSIVLFALMTGASATTIRASLMALILIMSGRVGRNYNVTRALVVAGFLMLLSNPQILVFDIGFQLSFLSTLALIYVSPIIQTKLEFVTESFELKSILSTTISTQLFIFPFMLYSMGEVSLISLVTNILVLPFVPWSMFTGFVTGFIGFFGYYLALPAAWITDLMLSWMMLVVSYFGELSFAAARLTMSKPILVVIYVLYGIFIFRWHLQNSLQQSANSN